MNLICLKEELVGCSVTGTSSPFEDAPTKKEQLNPKIVDGICNFVLQEFGAHTSRRKKIVSFIRTKLNNSAASAKKVLPKGNQMKLIEADLGKEHQEVIPSSDEYKQKCVKTSKKKNKMRKGKKDNQGVGPSADENEETCANTSGKKKEMGKRKKDNQEVILSAENTSGKKRKMEKKTKDNQEVKQRKIFETSRKLRSRKS